MYVHVYYRILSCEDNIKAGYWVQVLMQYEAYQNALGVRSVAYFRPNSVPGVEDEQLSNLPSPLLAVGSFDGNVRMLSTMSYKVAFVYPCVHPNEMMPTAINNNSEVVMNVEVLDASNGNSSVVSATNLDDSMTEANASVDMKSSAYSTK